MRIPGVSVLINAIFTFLQVTSLIRRAAGLTVDGCAISPPNCCPPGHAMSAPFDPYHKWLGIPADEQPPSLYRLLGLRPFEHDADVIDTAADQRMRLLKTFQGGKHGPLSQKLLNEISRGRVSGYSRRPSASTTIRCSASN